MSDWAEVIIGGWLLVSTWVMGGSGITLLLWSNTLVGTVLILMGLWNIYGEAPEDQKPNGKK